MSAIHWHEDPRKLIADAAVALGEQHPVVAALRDVFERGRELDERIRDLERRLDETAARLDRSHMPR